MKELSIEEKAKRYDEALASAKNTIEVNQAIPDIVDCVESLFPELADEDERIRKALINQFSDYKRRGENHGFGYSNDKILAWLEKQGEHANFRNKIQIGDKVTRNEDGVLVNLSQLKRVAKKDEKQGGQKPADKVEPKFKVGDEIKTANEEPLTITKIDEKGYWSEGLFICGFDEECIWDLVEQKTIAWTEEDEEMYAATIFALARFMGNEDKIDWLKSLKDRVQPQPKQEWSEKDEKTCNIIISHYKSHILNHTNISSDDKIIKWLKSLKERYTWKPSDEQMTALDNALSLAKNCGEEYAFDLRTLYEQLKKLMEE